MTKRLGTAAAAAILLAISLVVSGCTASRLEPGGGVDARAVLEEFNGRGMVGHLEALQRIADDNGGNRASGTSGYEESARYVEEQLRAAGYTPVRQTFTFRGDGRNRKQVETFNILAETGGSAANTVVVGGHLDSVQEGPGINDNGSGVAAILETAKWMKENGITPVNRVVFAFWGAEEDGLYGSQHYVDELSKAEKDQTAANLNVDMAASPNGVRSFHDGDGSDFGDAGPKGSDGIEDVFFRLLPGELAAGGNHALCRRRLRLRRVPQGRHSRRRAVHRRGEEKDQSPGAGLRRRGRQGPRFLLPQSLRHHQQHQRRPVQGNVRRPGLRHRVLRPGPTRLTSSSRRTVTAPRRFGRLPEGAVR